MSALPSYIQNSKVYAKILEENSEELLDNDVPLMFQKEDLSISDDEDLIRVTEIINYWDLPIPLSVWEYLFDKKKFFKGLNLQEFFGKDIFLRIILSIIFSTVKSYMI
jgi:hypothetical protein